MPVRPPLRPLEPKAPKLRVIPAAEADDAAYEQIDAAFDHAMEHRALDCAECRRWMRLKRIALEIFE